MTFRYHKNYFLIFLLFLVVEIIIAVFVHDNFIRPYLGDYLVVFVVYCFVMSFVKAKKYKVAFAVLVFAYFIELLQYANFITAVGLQDSKLARTVIGTSFSFEDLLLYFLGYVTLLFVEKIISRRNKLQLNR